MAPLINIPLFTSRQSLPVVKYSPGPVGAAITPEGLKRPPGGLVMIHHYQLSCRIS